MTSDYCACALAADDSVRIVAARTTKVVAVAQSRHGCSPTVAAALGRLLTGAALMGSFLKGRERVTLQVNGTGPVRGLIAEASAGGRVRGYPLRSKPDLPLNPNGKFDVAGVVGRGFLHVTRAFDTGLPYTSAVPLASGEIGDDLSHFFASSEQVPSVVAVGVLANPQGILAAGGFLAHLLPGAHETTIETLEDNVRSLPHVSTMIRQGFSPEDIVARVAGSLGTRVTQLAPVTFRCTCDRVRVSKVLIGLGAAELGALARKNEDTEVTCDFCSQRYYFAPQEIEELLVASRDRESEAG